MCLERKNMFYFFVCTILCINTYVLIFKLSLKCKCGWEKSKMASEDENVNKNKKQKAQTSKCSK